MVLAVNNMSITFGGQSNFTAVQDVSFGIARGETLAIVGESGSGKSLTALAIMGLLPKGATISGTLSLHSDNTTYDLRTADMTRLRGRAMGIVFQEPMTALDPVMTVGKQLREAILAHQKMTKAEARSVAISWLEKVQLPDAERTYMRYPHELSGGQKQRIMIAMAMCNHPALLIADEPTTALDVTVQQEIIRLMRYLQEEHGTAMIFITHDLALAATIADKALVLYKGGTVEYGDAAKVLHHPQEAYTRALLECRPSAGNKGKRLPVVDDILHQRQPEDAPADIAVQADRNIVLSVQDLKVRFPAVRPAMGIANSWHYAVDGVSFDLHKGTVLGLVGESGCGKSTLSRTIMGLVPAYSGHIAFAGQDLVSLPLRRWRAVRQQIQMVFQDPYSSLDPRMTISDMLAEPMMAHGVVNRAEVPGEVTRLLSLVQLSSSAARKYPHEFSGGQRQRIGIARALASRPALLICDESVSALDVSIQAQILNLLRDLQRELALTYLFISHDLAVVHYISDRVMVMHEGKIVEQGSANEVMERPTHPYTQKLLSAVVR
jgi:peptide/nickel transport system ATP-binding protein